MNTMITKYNHINTDNTTQTIPYMYIKTNHIIEININIIEIYIILIEVHRKKAINIKLINIILKNKEQQINTNKYKKIQNRT